MIIMNLEFKNILGFPEFKMNFSYPKKIVNSTIEGEYLSERKNFRYKKAIVLMCQCYWKNKRRKDIKKYFFFY